jgi:hypothetical protein
MISLPDRKLSVVMAAADSLAGKVRHVFAADCC